MGVIVFEKTWSGRNYRSDARNDGRSATEIYTVLCDSLADTELTVRADSRCPGRDSSYQGDVYMKLVDIDVRKLGPMYYTVQANYAGANFESISPSPLPTQPPRIKWSAVQERTKISHDVVTGLAIKNTNGEEFEDLPEVEVSDALLTATLWFTSFDAESIIYMTNTVNLNHLALINAPPKTGRINNIEAEPTTIDGVNVWQVVVQIQFRSVFHPQTSAQLGWVYPIMNRGYKVRPAAGAEPVHALDGAGQKVAQPVRIKADGTLAVADGDTHWILWNRYKPLDWTPLGLT
jgi:hypothetical protein